MKHQTHSTYFGLLAEFGAAEIPLEDCCDKYFGVSEKSAKRRAASYSLPVKAYRAGSSQKSGWLVSISDLATHIDEQKAQAEKHFRNMREAS